MIKRLIPVFLSFTSTAAFVLGASAETYLTPDQMIAALMDGKRWAMTTRNGMQGSLILRRDGTGLLDGPFTAPSTWRVAGEDICMVIRTPMPVDTEKCFRVRRSASGFQAFEKEIAVFTLKR